MARNDGVENVMPRASLYATEKLLPSVNVNTARPVSASISTDLNRLFVVSLASTPVLLPFTVQTPFLSMPISGTDVATGILLPSFPRIHSHEAPLSLVRRQYIVPPSSATPIIGALFKSVALANMTVFFSPSFVL